MTGPRQRRRPVRWRGVALAHETDWLVLLGPFPHANDGHVQADACLTPARTDALSLSDTANGPQPRSHHDRLLQGLRADPCRDATIGRDVRSAHLSFHIYFVLEQVFPQLLTVGVRRRLDSIEWPFAENGFEEALV